MNDDELRSILKGEAERVEVGDHSWSRLESRLTANRSGSAARSFAFGGIAIAVVLAIVASAMWLGHDDRDSPVASSTRHALPQSAPRRILAMTAKHQPVVLDAKTGKRTAQYESHSYAEGTQLAVAPEGRDFYFVDGKGNKGCQNHTILRFGLRGGHPGAQIADEASEPTISPDGRYLAYYHCLPGDERPDELVLRDLASGVERATKAQATEWFGERLAFDRDSSHVVYESISNDDPTADGVDHLYRLDLVGGEALPGASFGLAPDNWFGVQGSTGRYLGRLSGRADPATGRIGDLVMSIRPTNSELPRVFAMGRLFWFAHTLRQVVSDPTGEHILSVVDHTLYRWSEGDKKPTKIRDGIIAAAWIPDSPVRPLRPAPPIVAVRTGATDPGPTVVLDPGTGAQRSKVMSNTVQPAYISASGNGADLVFSPARPTNCTNDGGPGVQRVSASGGSPERIVSGSFSPVVNSRNLVAYGIVCDGPALGFTNLTTGQNFRSDPLGDRPREASPNLEKVEPLGWSPDGTRLLYRLRLRRDSNPHYYVGALWPAVPSKRTKIVPLPDGAKVTAATFVDDHRVLLALAVGRGTQLRTWHFDRRSRKHPSLGAPILPRDVTSLVADQSGLHILALADGNLYRWDRGDSAFRALADHIAAAVWLGSR